MADTRQSSAISSLPDVDAILTRLGELAQERQLLRGLLRLARRQQQAVQRQREGQAGGESSTGRADGAR